jgi:ABC-type uncharacterized transport system substrate-binding protein
VRRREVIAALGGAAAWPLTAPAQQQPALPTVGYLSGGSQDASLLAAFQQGLKEAGYVDGQNVAIEYRYAQGQYDRLPELARSLVAHRVAVLTAHSGPAALAAKSEAGTIPIVFVSGADPIASGLVVRLNRPEGNATGAYLFTLTLDAKRLELMRSLFPNVGRVGMLVNPFTHTDQQLKAAHDAARALGFELSTVEASSETTLKTAFATVVERRIEALVVSTDPLFLARRNQIIALAAHHAMPAVYGWREFAAAGGLISYAASLAEAERLAGVYTGRVLGGEKPADLPVQQSTKVELVINLKTANALGMTVPQGILAIADEVIE